MVPRGVLSVLGLVLAVTAQVDPRTLLPDPTCVAIESAISSASAVYYYGTLGYISDNAHYISSSSDTSLCSVEPGTANDVAAVLGVLANTTTPFGIKGGGHASNPGFSSTPGVLIAMTRFNSVVYHASSSTADIGTGLIWDDVYAALEPYGVNVVGGRVSGVGMAGFTLGGGYSWLTNLHGLTVDTVVSYELVLPNSRVITVTESAYPDLFFGLKGGFNNFGIVTKITLKTFAQGQVWGGIIEYAATSWPAVSAAVKTFNIDAADPNANIIQAYNALAGLGIGSLLVFYNGPSPPAGLFDAFEPIPYVNKDIKTRSFLDFVKSSPVDATAGMRGTFQSVSLTQLTPSILDQIVNQTLFYGVTNLLGVGTFVSYAVEPFLPTAYSHATDSAWPHSQYLSPLNLYFAWPLGLSDDIFIKAIQESANVIRNQAIAEGQQLSALPIYSNYAIAQSSLEAVYGGNVARLQGIKKTYDPTNLMGRAGGFKF